MISDFDGKLENEKDRRDLVKNLKYRVVYDSPVQRNMRNHRKKLYRFDKDDPSEQDTAFDDILSYNNICDHLNREMNNEDGQYWKFRKILGYQHTPIGHPKWKGSKYNVKIL